jgi:L-threonylcarbamoyladenylate synthase
MKRHTVFDNWKHVFRSCFILSWAMHSSSREAMRPKLEVLSSRPRDINKAASIVKTGGIIAFPTDTVYGLGCDPHSSRALTRLLSLKGGGRRDKPFPILVGSPKLAERIAALDSQAKALASRFWPGPLTVVVKPRVRFPHSLTMGRKTIAIRCPRNEVTLQLIRECGGFLTGTSANITGRPPCTSARMVCLHLSGRLDAVVDGGRSPRRIGSTVVRVDSRGAKILRRGPIGDAQIRRTLLCSGAFQKKTLKASNRLAKPFFKH